MDTSVCVVYLFGVHHHVTHDANGQRVRLEHGFWLCYDGRSEIKPYLCVAACKDENKDCDYGCFYSHNSIRKYIKIYY